MLKYSFSPNPFPDNKPLNGATIPSGMKIYAYYEPFVASEAPYSFWDSGIKIGNNESQVPIEVMNGNGWTPAPGSHTLEIKDKSGNVKETAVFSVSSVTTPPTDKEIVTINAKVTNPEKFEFKFTVNGSQVEN